MQPAANETQKLLTYAELAELLGISEDQCRDLANQGKIPGKIKLGYKTIRFSAKIIHDWLDFKLPEIPAYWDNSKDD